MTEFIDIDVTKFVGMDIEREDTDVGIFGNVFILCFKDKEGKQLQLALDDEQFQSLYDKVKEEGQKLGYEYQCEEEG